jgi:hypothetical protein
MSFYSNVFVLDGRPTLPFVFILGKYGTLRSCFGSMELGKQSISLILSDCFYPSKHDNECCDASERKT